jgi:hypothetical protein
MLWGKCLLFDGDVPGEHMSERAGDGHSVVEREAGGGYGWTAGTSASAVGRRCCVSILGFLLFC